MKKQTLFSLGLFLATPVLAGVSPPGLFDNCPAELSAFASAKTGTEIELPWAGVKKAESLRFSWTRLTFPSFDPILIRMGVRGTDIERMKGWMRLLRVEGADARKMLPDEPAVLASYALATFMQLTHSEPQYALYAAVVADEVSDDFALGSNARYLIANGNFDFVDSAALADYPRLERRRGGLERPIQAVLLRDLPDASPVSAHEEWFADLMAAMQRRNDYAFLHEVIYRHMYLKLDWLPPWLGSDPTGRIAFATPQWPLFIESRAELVRAWALHRIRGGEWDPVFFESQARALEHVGLFTAPEVLAPYYEMENGLYWDHTLAVAQSLRSVK